MKLEDIQKGLDAINPTPPPQPAAGDRSLDAVQNSLTDIKPPKQPQYKGFWDAFWTNFKKSSHDAVVDMENRRLGGEQRTSPHLHEYGESIGVFKTNDADQHFAVTKDNKWIPFDPARHVRLRDKETSEYRVYNRSKETDYGEGFNKIYALGSLVTEGLGGSTLPIASRAPKIVEDANRVGVRVPAVARSESEAAHGTASVLSNIPIARAPFVGAAATMEGDIAQAGERIAKMPTGERVSADQAGKVAREAVDKWSIVTSQSKVDKAYNAVDAHINPNTAIYPRETLVAAQQLVDKYQKAGFEKGSAALAEVIAPITKPGGLTFESLKFVRTRIGKLIQNPGELAQGINEQELKFLYGKLTDDMRAHIQVAGTPKAMELWERANNLAKLTSERRENLGRILSVKNDEGIFHRLLSLAGSNTRADIELLQQARKTMSPNQWKEIAGGAANYIGMKVTAEGGRVFDATKFVTDVEKMSDKGKNILFGSKEFSPMRQSIESLVEVSKRWPATEKLSHPSAGGHVTGALGLTLAISHVMHDAYKTGSWKEPLAAAAIAFGGHGMAQILSQPQLASQLTPWARAYTSVAIHPTKVKIQRLNRLTQNIEHVLSKKFSPEPEE